MKTQSGLGRFWIDQGDSCCSPGGPTLAGSDQIGARPKSLGDLGWTVKARSRGLQLQLQKIFSTVRPYIYVPIGVIILTVGCWTILIWTYKSARWLIGLF